MFPMVAVFIPAYCVRAIFAILEMRIPKSKEPRVGRDIWSYNTSTARQGFKS